MPATADLHGYGLTTVSTCSGMPNAKHPIELLAVTRSALESAPQTPSTNRSLSATMPA